MNRLETSLDFRRIETAIEFIDTFRDRQPTLEEIARHVHLSPYHFQRMFTNWAGVSPKKFLQYLTIRYAKEQLEKSSSLEEVAFAAGLSGSSRLHDLFLSIEGMTPGQYRSKGKGIRITYGFHSGLFGPYLLAVTGKQRICSLLFFSDKKVALDELKAQWTSARLVYDPSETGTVAARLFNPGYAGTLDLLVHGTPFQLKVWEALLKIPAGHLVSYQAVAEYVGNPLGVQAVGNAIGKNPVAWLIPCHRVIRKTGGISEYRWGSTRKKALIGWEASVQARLSSADPTRSM